MAWYRERQRAWSTQPVLGQVGTRSTEAVEEYDHVQDCHLTQGRLQWFIGGQLNVSSEQWLDEHSRHNFLHLSHNNTKS